LNREYFDILIFGQKMSKANHLRIHRKTFTIGFCLFALVYFCSIFFCYDYIQIKKEVFALNRLRLEMQAQKAQIQSFSDRIKDLETHLSRLKDFDRKIRIITNIKKGEETATIMGIGGPSPTDIREKLKRENDDNGLIEQMRNDIERLKSEAMSRKESLSELEKLLQSKKEMLAHTPSLWPTVGWVTSDFGFRINPFTGLTHMHEGIDISNRVGTLVIAPADGVISDIGDDWIHGKVLVITHGFGITTRYAHLNRVLVRIGQKVKRGEKIAEIGMSGKTTGPHLHYEVRLDRIPVNPMKYMMN
jgi:murein DD-endopeptidase MepM/ murein hydrolase activator NlpD